MLEPLSVGLRIGMFFMLALVQIREHVPFSIDSDQRGRTVSDSMRYDRGEIWWYENRDDLALMSTKIRACELNSLNATRFGRRLGCYIQRIKLRTRRQLTGMAKNAAQFFVEQSLAYMDALSGPNALLAVVKLMVSMGSTALGIAKLIYHRQYLLDIVKNYIEERVNSYLPKTPEPPSFQSASIHNVPDVYISEEARNDVRRAKEREAATAVAAAAVPDIVESDEDEELTPVRVSPRESPRGSPRGSTRGNARESPRTQAVAHGGYSGAGLDLLPTRIPPSPTSVQMRGSSPRRQRERAMSVDDNEMDRIGALDNATARVIRMFRGAGGPGADQENCDGDIMTTHPEATEPLIKKRVAFKDDLIDSVRRDPSPRRMFNIPPPPRDILDPLPPDTNPPPELPRLQRYYQRTRPGGVPGRRPLLR